MRALGDEAGEDDGRWYNGSGFKPLGVVKSKVRRHPAKRYFLQSTEEKWMNFFRKRNDQKICRRCIAHLRVSLPSSLTRTFDLEPVKHTPEIFNFDTSRPSSAPSESFSFSFSLPYPNPIHSPSYRSSLQHQAPRSCTITFLLNRTERDGTGGTDGFGASRIESVGTTADGTS